MRHIQGTVIIATVDNIMIVGIEFVNDAAIVVEIVKVFLMALGNYMWKQSNWATRSRRFIRDKVC